MAEVELKLTQEKGRKRGAHLTMDSNIAQKDKGVTCLEGARKREPILHRVW